MHCYVYASLRKPDTYLWLSRQGDFGVIPASLALMLGDLRLALEVELSGERRLPQEDVHQVLEHLRGQGWHLQMPPPQNLATSSNHLAYRSAPEDRGMDRSHDRDH